MLQNEEIIVLSMFRKLLEQLDGIFSLVDIRSEGPATILLRSLFEISLGINYILINPTKIKERASFYYVGYIKEELKILHQSLASNDYSLFSHSKLTELMKQRNKEINDFLNESIGHPYRNGL